MRITEDGLPRGMPMDLVKLIISYGGEDKAIDFYGDKTVLGTDVFGYSNYWRRWYWEYNPW